ncbi:MAG: hypothetical protein MK208_02110 [Shimia sp.]|nr:hypothetical protein [Shimia sp.]
MKAILSVLVLMCLPSGVWAKPLYENSVASNNLDFIRANDPGACWSIKGGNGGRTEMYDPRSDRLFVDGALHFEVRYPGQALRINVHPGVSNPTKRAQQAAASVSRLPEQMRKTLSYVNILDGDGAAWAEDRGRFFTLYDGLMARRLAEHDLDETVFHETAHVAFDLRHAKKRKWKAAQKADGDFVTRYAARHAHKEDIAESALFVWTMMYHPGRLPKRVEQQVSVTIPSRVAYLQTMLAGYEPPRCAS